MLAKYNNILNNLDPNEALTKDKLKEMLCIISKLDNSIACHGEPVRLEIQ